MSKIKARKKVNGVKVLDSSKVVGARMKNAFIRSKGHAKNLADDGQATPSEYAEDQVQYAAEDISRDAAHTAGSGVKAAGRKGKEAFQRHRAKGTVKTTQRTVKTAQRAAKGAVKTAERTSKTAIKTAEHTVKATQRVAQATAKAAKVATQAARAAAKATARAIAAAVKATIAEVNALITAIAAGGWVAILIIVIICMIGLLVGSCFGIFFSGEDTSTSQTLQAAVQEINQGYEASLEAVKVGIPHDVLDMSGSRAAWPDVLAVYAVKTATDPNNSQEVATMDNGKKALLEEIFWAMNEVSSYTETVTTTRTVETVDGDGNIIVSEVEVTNYKKSSL